MEAERNEGRGWLWRAGKPLKSPGGLGWRRASGLTSAVLSTLACCGLVSSSSTPSLLWVQAPLEGALVGIGGVEVRVRFPRERGIEVGTFVALLNGADVTAEFTTGSNGAIGRLFGVLDGENTLRLEVQGDRGGLPDRLLRDTREVRFLVRLPQGINRG
jgi:hypothetical protein